MPLRWARAALPAACCIAVVGAAHSAIEVGTPTQRALGQVLAEEGLRAGTQPQGVHPLDSASGLLQHGAGTCDVSSSGPICSSGRAWALVPPAVVPGLVGHWTFDEEAALDSSGSGNHGASEVLHGPSPTGSGHSAVFRKSFLLVPNSACFQVPDFSYSFWVYLAEDVGEKVADAPHWCPLLRKGIYASRAQEFASAPALLFSRHSGHLRASVTTTESRSGDGEFVCSNARLLPNRWMHVAVVHRSALASLSVYVNGILDASTKLHGAVVHNEYPLYVGGDPFTADQCEHTVYIDELRAYGRAVAPHEFQAEAAPALGGIDPSYVHLGCLSCSLQEAGRSCPPSRHVCTSLELHTGGYQVARSLGWIVAGVHVWTHAAIAKKVAVEEALDRSTVAGMTPQLGLGLCCEGQA